MLFRAFRLNGVRYRELPGLGPKLAVFLSGDAMGEQEGILDEILGLISEQMKALGGILSEEEAMKCRAREERLEDLLELIERDGFGKA